MKIDVYDKEKILKEVEEAKEKAFKVWNKEVGIKLILPDLHPDNAIRDMFEHTCGKYLDIAIKEAKKEVFDDIDKNVFGKCEDGFEFADEKEYKKLKKKHLEDKK